MKRRHLIAGTIMPGMLTAWFLLLILPTMERQHRLKADLHQAEIHLADFGNIIKLAGEYCKTHAKIMDKKEQITSQLYSRENLMSLFDALERMALDNGLKVVEFTPSVEELLMMNRTLPDENKPQVLNIVMTLKGGLRNMGDFLRKIESEKYYQGIDICRITNTAEGQENSDIVYGFKALLGVVGK